MELKDFRNRAETGDSHILFITSNKKIVQYRVHKLLKYNKMMG